MSAIARHVDEATTMGPCRSPDGRYGIGIVRKRVIAYSQSAPVASIRTSPEVEGELLLEDADGLCVHKPCTDLIVQGSAFSDKPVAHVDVSVEVGATRHRLRVHGPRRVRVRDGKAHFEAESLLQGQQRLTFANAYGGSIGGSRTARGAFGARENADIDPTLHFYPRNPAGRGFATRDTLAALDGTLAPCQELESDPVTADRLVRADVHDWASAPLAGDFGPIAFGWFPRVQWLVPFSERELGPTLLERRLCGMTDADCSRTARQPDPRVLSCAAPGLALPFQSGVVPIALTGLSWGGGRARITVDTTSPPARVRFPGAGEYQAEMTLKTITVEADREQVSLVWGGFQPTAMRYREEHIAGLQLS